MGPLEVEDAAFWTDPFRHVDRVQWRLWSAAPPALVLDAPSRVALDERTTLPFAGCVSTPSNRGAELHGRLLVVAWCEPEDVLRVGRVLDALPEPQPVPDDGSTAILPYDACARERLGLPWAPSRLTLWTVASEAISNPAPVVLEGPGEPPARALATPSEEVLLGRGAARDEPTLALSADDPARLTGFFAVRPEVRYGELVPVTLLLHGVGLADGIVLPLHLPARPEGEHLVGGFTLDLLARTGPLRPGPVHVHAFTAGLAARPVTFEA